MGWLPSPRSCAVATAGGVDRGRYRAPVAPLFLVKTRSREPTPAALESRSARRTASGCRAGSLRKLTNTRACRPPCAPQRRCRHRARRRPATRAQPNWELRAPWRPQARARGYPCGALWCADAGGGWPMGGLSSPYAARRHLMRAPARAPRSKGEVISLRAAATVVSERPAACPLPKCAASFGCGAQARASGRSAMPRRLLERIHSRGRAGVGPGAWRKAWAGLADRVGLMLLDRQRRRREVAVSRKGRACSAVSRCRPQVPPSPRRMLRRGCRGATPRRGRNVPKDGRQRCTVCHY